MPKTSEHGGAILYDPTDLDTDEPMDEVLCRDIFNNAMHFADEAGQVRASWVALALGVDNAGPLEPVDASGSLRSAAMVGVGLDAVERSAWYAFGPRARFDARVTTDGRGYRLRVMLAGASSTGVRVDFGVLLAPAPASAADILGGAGVVLARVDNVTATSPGGWLDWGDGTDTVIDVPKEAIAEAWSRHVVTTQTDIGGEPTTVYPARLEVIVVAQTWEGLSGVPRLYGLHVAEVNPPPPPEPPEL